MKKFTCSRCENLLDLADASGLTRHEREVHNMHGGRQQLYCPYEACKRSTEDLFARPENLQKHLRRLHSRQGIDSHEAARRDGRRSTKVVSELDSDMQSLPSNSNRPKFKDGRQDSSEKINRTLVADLKAGSSSIQAMYDTHGVEITDLKGQLGKLRAHLEDCMRDWEVEV